MTKSSDALARIMVEGGLVTVGQENTAIKHTSGMWVPFRLNTDLVQSNVSLRRQITNMLEYKIHSVRHKPKNFVIAGIQSGITSLTPIVANSLEVPHFSVRKDPNIGDGTFIEGGDVSDKDIILLDDVVRTGRSLLFARCKLEEVHARVFRCGAIFSYNNNPFTIGSGTVRTEFFSLLTMHDFMQPLLDSGLVTEEYWDQILEWLKNPQQWSDRYEELTHPRLQLGA